MKARYLLLPALAAAFASSALADVPQIIHHQGVLLDKEGQPYEGSPKAAFALVNQAGDSMELSCRIRTLNS